jgi:hypothetical protein
MKIRELLELTQTELLVEIAKNRLGISRDKTRYALKHAGCYSINGKRGWFFEGDESVLEQSIYDFVDGKQINRKQATTSAEKEVSATVEKQPRPKTKAKASTSELDSIDMLLLQSEVNSNQRIYRGFYWDKEIISFLDSVKHGNKSDLMNEIVRTILKNKGLI